jgi:hypothetical protein
MVASEKPILAVTASEAVSADTSENVVGPPTAREEIPTAEAAEGVVPRERHPDEAAAPLKAEKLTVGRDSVKHVVSLAATMRSMSAMIVSPSPSSPSSSFCGIDEDTVTYANRANRVRADADIEGILGRHLGMAAFALPTKGRDPIPAHERALADA